MCRKKYFNFLCDYYEAPRAWGESVRQWFDRCDPTEPQRDQIPEGVTWADIRHVFTAKRYDECPDWYYNLYSVPRDIIWHCLKSLQ